MNTMLIIVDMQNDFVCESGSLYVPGAKKDVQNVASLIRDIDLLDILATKDYHPESHIGAKGFWKDRNGNIVPAFTEITLEAYQKGDFVVVSPIHNKGAELYLLQHGKVMVWPEHCVNDTFGCMTPDILNDAINNSTISHWFCLKKGNDATREEYSVFANGANSIMLEYVKTMDRVIVVGEAADYCVANTVRDIIGDIPEIIVPLDCTSPVNFKNWVKIKKELREKGVIFFDSFLELYSL